MKRKTRNALVRKTRKESPTEFQKGDPTVNNANRRGRPKGAVNKITRNLREAIYEAMELYGEDGKGKRGAVGYLFKIAKEDISLMVRLIEKIIPQQTEVTGAEGGPVQVFNLPPEIIKRLPTEELLVMERVLTMLNNPPKQIEGKAELVSEQTMSDQDYARKMGLH